MNQQATSASSEPFSENAKVRLRLWRMRSAELLSDLAAFLPTSSRPSEACHAELRSSSPQLRSLSPVPLRTDMADEDTAR